MDPVDFQLLHQKQDIPIAETPVLLARSGTKVCFADTAQYSLLDLETKETISLIPFDTAHEKARSRPQHVGPQIRVIKDGEFLLSTTTTDSNDGGLFSSVLFSVPFTFFLFLFFFLSPRIQTVASESLFPRWEMQLGEQFSGLPFQRVLVGAPTAPLILTIICIINGDLFSPQDTSTLTCLRYRKARSKYTAFLTKSTSRRSKSPMTSPDTCRTRRTSFTLPPKATCFCSSGLRWIHKWPSSSRFHFFYLFISFCFH